MRNNTIVTGIILAIFAVIMGTTAFAGGEWIKAGKEDKVELDEKCKNSEKIYEKLIETGRLEEYKQMLLETKKEKLDILVESGKKTQKEADACFGAFKAKVENWDGTTDILEKCSEKAKNKAY